MARTSFAALGFVFAAISMVDSFAPVAAQQETVRYVGELTGVCGGFRGRMVEIDIQGSKIWGVVLRDGGDVRFSGEMKGTAFEMVAKSQTPVFVKGTIEGETIRVTFDREECTYRAVLKKKGR